MAKFEATVKDGDELLGHAIGEVTKDGDLAALVKQALDDFRRKNPTRPLMADELAPALTVSVGALED